MKIPVITLTDYQIGFADAVALCRRRSAVTKARPEKNGAPTDYKLALAIDQLGARAEIAGKLYLNPIVWHALSDSLHDLPDLGDFVDVKGRAQSWHQLIVQKDDQPDWAYLLIDCSGHPSYKIMGWEWGKEAQVPENWSDPAGGRPAYFVKQEKLHPAEELLEITRQRAVA